jgi:hypothetical protein
MPAAKRRPTPSDGFAFRNQLLPKQTLGAFNDDGEDMKKLIACIAATLSFSSFAQVTSNTPGWFAFPMSALDTNSAPIDLSYLNDKPAGKNGFLRAQNGVIVDGAGKRVKFFATNIGAGGAFVDQATATKIARNLAKLGVNLVRLHQLDYNWGVGLINIPDNGQINQINLAKLDFLVAELKKQGIYVNLNLHVTRQYTGTPAGFDFSKALDHFYPPYIAQFKKYARDLLSHRNPYTGLTYANEPAVMVIEVNNENTFGMFEPTAFTRLPAALNGELRRLWLEWLKAKYVTTAGLRAAWGLASAPGANLVANPNFANNAAGWALENNEGAVSSLGAIPGAAGVRWTATKAGAVDWGLQVSFPGLSVANGKGYRLSFRAKANAKHPFSTLLALDQAPYSLCGLNEPQTLTTSWQIFSYDFLATGTVPGHVRVLFNANNRPGTIDLADVKLQPISFGVLTAAQTLEAGNIPYTATSPNAKAKRDFIEFLVDTEHKHAEEARRYVKTDLGAKQMVNHSQIVFGGMAAAFREKPSDLVDNHAYWQHVAARRSARRRIGGTCHRARSRQTLHRQ